MGRAPALHPCHRLSHRCRTHTNTMSQGKTEGASVRRSLSLSARALSQISFPQERPAGSFVSHSQLALAPKRPDPFSFSSFFDSTTSA